MISLISTSCLITVRESRLELAQQLRSVMSAIVRRPRASATPTAHATRHTVYVTATHRKLRRLPKILYLFIRRCTSHSPRPASMSSRACPYSSARDCSSVAPLDP